MKLKTKTFLLKIITSFILLLAGVSSSYSQSQYLKFKCTDLTTDEIITKWSQLSNQTYNYSIDDLSKEQFTFSAEGTIEEITQTICSFLGLTFTVLEDVTILTVTDNPPQFPEYTFHVVDEDGQALPFAHVRIKALNMIDVTNIDGKFTFHTLLSLSDTITINYLGYEESNRTIKNILARNHIIQLQPSSESVSEIIVIGKTYSSTSLENIELSSIPQAGALDQDVMTVTQNLPGINNPSESFQDLIIRGGSPDHVQYRWNGIRILQSSHLFGKISSFNPYMIDKIEISKDGYSASSQGTVSGGLHMKSKRKIDTLGASLHINMLYTNLGFSIPITPTLSAKVAVRQSLPDRFQSPLALAFQDQIFQFGKIPDEDILIDKFNLQSLVQTQTQTTFGDRQLSLRYQVTPQLILEADVLHIDNALEFSTFSEVLGTSTKDALYQSNVGYNLSAQQYWTPYISSTLSFNQSDYTYNYRDIPETADPEFVEQEQHNEIGLTNLKLDNTFRYKWLRTSVGYEYNTWNTAVLLTNVNASNETNYTNTANEHVAFITMHPDLITNLHIDLGLRFSAYNKSLDNRKLLEPRVHVKYRLNKFFQFHGHYGKYHQYLSRRNIFTPLQADNGFWFLADESASEFLDFVNIIESNQIGGGLDIAIGSMDYSIDVYKKKTINIYSSSFDLSIDENPFRVGDVDIVGAECMLRYHHKGHTIMSTYEYNNERILFDQDEQAVLNPFSQPHRFLLAYEWKYKILSSTLQYNFAQGRPFTEATALLIENNSANIQFDDLLDQRVPTYQRLDLSIATVPFGKNTKHSFGFQLNNILNRDNIIKNQYFINLLENPVELGLLQKRGIGRTFNIFWQIDI